MKTNRLLGIVITLLERQRISARELAALFEVSERTIYRDIEAISMAGVPVFATPGKGGGIQIMPGYKLDKSVFSRDDLSTLLAALTSLDGVLPQETLARTRAKVSALIPSQSASEVHLQADRIRIDPSPWLGNRSVDHHLATIRSAIDQQRQLRIDYLNGHGSRSQRTIEPHQLVLKNGSWYVYSHCHSKQDFRLFKLSRIVAPIEEAGETFAPRPLPPADLDAQPIAAELQTEATLRIHRRLTERLLDYCPFDRFQPDGPDHYLVRLPFIDRDYYYDLLLSFGDGCEIIAPPHIRERMRAKTAHLAALYEPRR